METPEHIDARGEWQLHLDLHVTRRKTYHTIIEPGGDVAYSARYVSEALAWLDMVGVRRYVLFPSPHHALAVPTRPIMIERQD